MKLLVSWIEPRNVIVELRNWRETSRKYNKEIYEYFIGFLIIDAQNFE